MDKFFDEAGRFCERAQEDLLDYAKGFFSPGKLRPLAIAVWAPLVAAAALILIAYFAAAKSDNPDTNWFDPLVVSTAPYFIAGVLTTIWLRTAAIAKPVGWTEAIMVFAGIGCLASLLVPFWGHITVITIYFALLFVADYHHANHTVHSEPVRNWFRRLATSTDALLWIPVFLLLLSLLAVENWFPTLDDHRFGSPFWTGFDFADPTAFGLDRRAVLHLFAGTQGLVAGLMFLLQLGKAPTLR